ncbi:MAG: tRNA/rRNA cytosine-C5-methylase [Magnetococcales bacterium]|nr:tRNA/rRNA cytosine-C5-methylase [Magnetococcales bacterium]
MATLPDNLNAPQPGVDDIAQAGLLLEDIFSTRHAADRLLDRHFRTHHTGQASRRHIGALVYQVLRHRDLLTAQLHHHFPGLFPDPKALAALAAVTLAQEAGRDLSPWPAPLPSGAKVGNPPFDAGRLPPWQRLSLPEWIWEAWLKCFGLEETQALVNALNAPAPVDVRINSRKTTREALSTQLETLGIGTQPTPFSPDGLRLQGRPALANLELYRQGLLEVQDEGSQLIGHWVAAQPGMTVIDFCAGAGGKALHLATLMADRGRIWAMDTDGERLRRLGPRSKRGGIKSIRSLTIRHEGDPALKKHQRSAHRVLVDAPCSATGTLRRNPEVKWRLTSATLETFYLRQCAILQAASRLVGPRGRLIYATCSLMSRENADVVEGFLAENRNFRSIPPSAIFPMESLQGLLPASPFFTLLPHRTRTDGFFAAILECQS